MKKVLLFLLGKKGFEVLNAAVSSGLSGHIAQVIVGRDDQIHEDFSDEIIDLCKKSEIPYCERNSFSLPSVAYENYVAFAAGWRWLIKEPFFQVIVFHDSLLPKYRGFNPLVTALLKKDPVVGVTAIVANKEFDRGDIVGTRSAVVEYPVKIKDVIESVSYLYFDLAKYIFHEVLRFGFLTGIAQEESEASYSVWRDEDDYRVDWSWSAEEIAHFVDCLSFPYKGASAICDGKLIRILEVKVEPDVNVANRDIGKVLFVDETGPVVICGVGLLRLVCVCYDDGKNALPFNRFRLRLR